MSELEAEILDLYVAGNDLEMDWTVQDLTSPLAKAWLTIKRHRNQSDDDAQIQKMITTTPAAGVGQITEAGGVDTDGELKFELTDEETLALGTDTWIYDCKVLLEDGKLYSIEIGKLRLVQQVTDATS